MRTSSEATVFLVDDHELIRLGLCDLIDKTRDLRVCGEAGSIAQTLQRLERREPPDVAVIDLSLPDGSGIELIKRLCARYPEMRLLVYTMYDEELFAERALLAGARGFVDKQETGETLVDAIRQLLKGKLCLSQAMQRRLASETQDHRRHKIGKSPVERLSDREMEVYEMIGQGHKTAEIAQFLHLSVKTVQTYLANIKNKLHLDSGTALTTNAVQWRLEQIGPVSPIDEEP